MNPKLATAIVQAAVELAYLGVDVSKSLEEAKANGGRLPQQTLDRIEQEVADANTLWEDS